MMWRSGILGVVLACMLGGAAAQDGANTYVNARFGTSIDYPAGWTIVKPGPANDDGRTFTDGSDQAKFLVYGRYNVDGKGIAALQREAVEYVLAGIKPSYSRIKDRWFVVSTIVGDTIVYHKELLSADGAAVHTFHAEYPRADKARYDAAVTLMANSLGASQAN